MSLQLIKMNCPMTLFSENDLNMFPKQASLSA